MRYVVWVLVMLSGCGSSGSATPDSTQDFTPAAPDIAVTVMMGDSITSVWQPPCIPSVNAGGNGETSLQMTYRFQHDVIDAHAAVVHILAGTNDLIFYGPMPSLDSLAWMVRTAQATGIVVILGTIPPADFTAYFPPDSRIADWNARVKQLAADSHVRLVDYNAAMGGAFNPALYSDNRHPNAAGYALMCAELTEDLH